MSDPNVPRPDEQRDQADQPVEGFSVTHEQHAAPSAPAAPGLGEPAQPFSAPAVDPVTGAPGQPAFSSGSEPGQEWQQGQHDPLGAQLPGTDAPGTSPHSAGQAGADQPGAAPFGQPGSAPSAQPGHYGQQPPAGQPPYGQQSQDYGQPGSAPQYGSPQYGAPQFGAPQQGAPQYGAPQYGAPGQPQYAAGAPMSPVDEKNAGMWGHLSGLSTIVTGGWGGWIGPLIVFLMYKDRSAFARQESKEALNFGIFMTILTIGLIVVGSILSIVGIGFLLLALWWVPGLLQVIFSIVGAMRVNNGGSYRYPFNWRLVK